jgi:hypothetical protein
MAVAIDDGAQPLVLGVASTAGFLRIVDRNAIVIDIPRHCALHRALSRPGRAPGITLRCRNPHAAHESVCVQGFGSVGPAHPDAASADSGLVCFRMTAFAVSWLCDGPAPQSSNLPEAS